VVVSIHFAIEQINVGPAEYRVNDCIHHRPIAAFTEIGYAFD
jgi:hypothetical protein